MARGRLGYDKWSVTEQVEGSNFYIAQRVVNGKTETHEFSAHCLACAKSEVLAQYGGQVDLRGLHLSSCGDFAYSMQMEVLREEKNEKSIK